MNTYGIGAKVYLFKEGKIQYQQLMLTRGFMSSSEPRLHFGLDSLSFIDSILVVWPNQKYQLLKKVAANQQLLFRQQDAVMNFNYENFFPKHKEIVEDVSKLIQQDWKHNENKFIDFSTQYLLPHFESTRGPKMAVADVNKDGLDDIFVCGARGQPGCLLAQTKAGKFIKWDTAVFYKNKESEEVDAIFFDANNDGYPDLFVASGGNEYEDGNPNLADHLYLNDGNGHFKESLQALPPILKNKSCVAVADINKDGNIDIFVGGLAIANKYGIAKESSYLLLNDGKGHFKLADDSVIQLNGIGIVTSASFTDVNQDGWADLIVAGEWMGVKVFTNHSGKFKSDEIAHSTGFWQTIFTTDFNGDGYPDILAGNWGYNSKLSAGKDDSLKMYVKDFDLNGSLEQIMTYFIHGQEYPFLGKDQLELALPLLKKGHLSYDEVAGKSVQYMFGDLLNNSVEFKAETLGSSYFVNDGKGNFIRKDLPEELQLAPIFSFSSTTYNRKTLFLSVGNFYGVMPYEGRYDALNTSFFAYDKVLGKWKMVAELPFSYGECRDIKWINRADGKKLIVISRNNDSLIFLKPEF